MKTNITFKYKKKTRAKPTPTLHLLFKHFLRFYSNLLLTFESDPDLVSKIKT